MQMIDRRRFLHHTLASMALGLIHCSGTASASADASTLVSSGEYLDAIKVLQIFLEKNLVSPSMQCGSRLGDGVPQYSEVEAFKTKILQLAQESSQALEEYLNQARHSDLVTDNTMTIDGWVLARTEVLAAASYVLLTHEDCKLPV